MSAFKRKRDGQESDTYWFKFELKGKQIFRRTPYTNKEQAEDYERAYRAGMEKTDCAGVKAALVQASYRRHGANLGQLLDAYRKHAGPVREITNPATVALNTFALRNIVARARNLDPRRLTPENIATLHALPATILTADLVDAYKSAVFERAQAADDYETAQSYYRSANSILRQARSLFTPDLLDVYTRRDNLTLPDLKPFLDRHGFNKIGRKDYHPPSEAILAKTFAALPELAQKDRNAFLAIWLTIGFGLRKSEIADLTPAAFFTHNGRPGVHLTLRTKNGDANLDIDCATPTAWEQLQPHIALATSENRPYILAGTHTDRHENTFRTISTWMRQLGWDTQKTHHEFRAWAGCHVALTDPRGILAARDFLRHATSDTTERFYGRYLKRAKAAYVPLQLPQLQPLALVSTAVS